MAKLGGHLIGYAVKKKNGELQKVILKHPKKNTITKSCINNLLTFDGTNELPSGNYVGNCGSLFAQSQSPCNRYGVINSSALGDGTGATSVDDIELKHRVTNATSTKKPGASWCGTTFDEDNATVKIRLTHIHNITEDFTVKEIGWYNQKWQELSYSLSARVQLDYGVPVENGDEFYSIYELTIEFQGVERLSGFTGISDGYLTNSVTHPYNAVLRGFFPYINDNGYGAIESSWSSYTDSKSFIYPIWLNTLSLGSGSYIERACSIKLILSDVDKQKPFLYASPSWSAAGVINEIKNYTADSFYRDMVVTLTAEQVMNKTIYAIAANGSYCRFGTFDADDNFTANPITLTSGLKLTLRQSWSTDLLTPTA